MGSVPRSVAIAATDGMLHFEMALAHEVFDRAPDAVEVPWYRVSVCGTQAIRVGRFELEPDIGLDWLTCAETVIVPALADIDDVPAALVEAVRAAHEAGARVVSLCTGAFVLAAAGLLDGLRATTHWAHTAELAARHPEAQVDPDVLYTDNGSVLTSAGKAAAMDLCLHLVRRDHGSAIANLVARRLVVPPHRAGGQAQFVTTPVPPARDGHRLAELLSWMMERLDQPLTVQDLARQAAMSSRHLTRHFNAATGTTPLQWLLIQRIRRAQELLETTEDSIDLVATASGLGTATTLRRHFHRTIGVPPDTYRRTFRDAFAERRQQSGTARSPQWPAVRGRRSHPSVPPVGDGPARR